MQYRQYYHERKLKDTLWLLLYALFAIAFVCLFFYYAPCSPVFAGGDLANKGGRSVTDEVFLQLDNAPGRIFLNIFVASVLVVVISLLFLTIFSSFPIFMTHFTYIMTILIGAALALFFFVCEHITGFLFWLLLITTLICLVLYLWSYSRLKFTATVIQNSLVILSKYPGIVGIIFFALFGAFIFTFLCFLMGTGIYEHCKDEPCRGLIPWLFLIVFFWWTLQIMINLVHTSICAVCGNYYFYTDDERQNIGAVSLKVYFRTLFYNLGSMIVGAMFVPINNFFTSLCKSKEPHQRIGRFRGFCIGCCGACHRYVETFNSYAFVQVGVCGKSYYESAIDTGYLLRERGFNIVMVDLVAEEFSFVLSLFVTSLVVLFISFTTMADAEAHLKIYTLVACLLFAFVISCITNSVISSTVVATSVCFSMDPSLFARRSPELYYRFKDRYAGFLNV